MSPRSLGFVLLALVVGLAAWILFGPDGGDSVPRPQGDGAEPAERSGASEGGRAEEARDAGVSRTDTDAASPSDAAAEYATPSDDPDAVAVYVKDAGTGAPAPQAEVLLLWNDELPEGVSVRTRGPGRNVEPLFSEFALRYRTDARGVTRVPPLTRSAYLMATAEGRSAATYVSRRDEVEEVVLALRPRVDLRVRLVGERGGAVEDVPVALLRFDPSAGWASCLRREYTDAEGSATFSNAHLVLADLDGREGPLRVRPAIPLAEPPSVEIDFDEPPQEEIVLRLPPLGRARVTLRDWKGEIPEKPSHVVMQSRMPDKQRGRFLGGWGFNPHDELGSDWRRTEDGVAEFPVGLGMTLEYGAVFRAGSGYVSAEALGPTTPGETVQLVLRQSTPPLTLVGRILGPSGAPLQNALLRTRLYYRGGSAGNRLDTDAEGRFDFLVRDDRQLVGDWRFLLIWGDSGREDEVWVGGVDLSHDLELGPNRVGDLRVGGPGTLIAGRVVTEDGEPLAEASVSCRWWSDGGHEHRGGGLRYFQAITGPDGGFRFRGRLPAVRLEVVVEHDSFPRVEQECTPGQEDVVVRMPFATAIAGRLLADDQVLVDPLPWRLVLERETDDAHRPWRRIASHEPASPDGRFRFAGLVSGHYRLQARSAEGAVLHEVAGLHVVDGRPFDDARLDLLDLRGLLHLRTVEVSSRTGEELAWAWAISLDPAGEPERVTLPWRFVAADEAPRFRVSAPGHRAREVALAEERTEVVLSPGIPVTFRLDAPRSALEDRRFSLELFHPTAVGGVKEVLPFDEAGSASAQLSWAGEYRAYVQRVLQTEQSSSGLRFTHRNYVKLRDGSQYLSFEITEASAGTEILVPVDAAALAHDD